MFQYSSLDEAGDYEFGMDSDISFSIPYLANMFSDDDQVHVGEPDYLTLNLEELDPILEGEIEDMSILWEESEESLSSQRLSIDRGEDEWSLSRSINTIYAAMEMDLVQQPSLILPSEDADIDNPTSIVHLLMAYGEAMEKEQAQLAEVIVKRLSEKASAVGETMERLLYYLFQNLDKKSDYLKQESYKIFYAAFKAFYQIYPYGKFAHFAANSAILEAMPQNREIIRIFDFDLGDGVQWSPMIETIAPQGKELHLTSIKWREGDSNLDPSKWNFEKTKRRLCDHARSFGLNLKVDEMEMCDLRSCIEKKRRRDGRREWFVFNCMVGLPHMGRVRSWKDVMEFLRVAKDTLVPNMENSNRNYHKGVITFGDGDGWEKLRNSLSFGSYLDGYLVHYQALLESMECNFPFHLGDARTAMECLFVSPFVSSLALIRKWEERKECCDLQSGFLMEGWKVRKESLMEAKAMVREGESLYGVRVEGETNNEMVLEWGGIELVRVTSWRS